MLTKLFQLFSEGSLLKRTLLHVGTFVVASCAFIGISSLLLVSVAKGLVPSSMGGDRAAVAASTAEPSGGADDESDTAPPTMPGAVRPRLGGARGHAKKRFGLAPVAE